MRCSNKKIYCSRVYSAISTPRGFVEDRRAISKLVRRVCIRCGVKFTVTKGNLNTRPRLFCSNECYQKWRNENSHAGNKNIELICPVCGKPFNIIPFRFEHYAQNFCSQECFYKWQSTREKGEKNHQWNSVKRKCEICGKEYYVTQYRIKVRGTGRFCSQTCASKAQWRDSAFVKKWRDAMQLKPNKVEQHLYEILQEIQPNRWEYNGNFEMGVMIGGKIPDFVNTNNEKIVIELFSIWHDGKFLKEVFKREMSWKRTEFGTKTVYTQLGYKCVIIQDTDLLRGDATDFVRSVLEQEDVF